LSCVVAIDKDWDAVKTTKARGVKFVVLVDTIWLPFKQGAFDITVASDVLEHIGDDVSALKEIYRVICASGLVYVTVPASRILYGSHDVALRHCRRYWKGTLLKKSTEAGFSSVIYQGCYNIIAFPAIATWRILQRILLRGVFRQSDVSIKWPKPLNQLLLMLIKIERSLKLVTISPVGVTLVFILRKSPISDRCRLV
jgi:SAM-dependent methyltransferase